MRVVKYELQTANSEQQIANSEQPTANSKQRIANSKQPTANSYKKLYICYMETSLPKKYDLSALSGHLFWDTPLEHIDGETHRAFIVERVMGYGRMKDWEIIKAWYGKSGLRAIVTQLRELDDFSLAFLSLVLDLKKEDFRCYTETWFQQTFWNS
jgi:hypothetical protein